MERILHAGVRVSVSDAVATERRLNLTSVDPAYSMTID